MTDEQQVEELAGLIKDVMAAREITQDELGRRVAQIEGRKDPYPQAHVAAWLRRPVLFTNPRRLIAIEEALELPAGYLTRQAGFLPIGAVDAVTVPQAIRQDTGLTLDQQEDLLTVYEVMVGRSQRGRTGRRPR